MASVSSALTLTNASVTYLPADPGRRLLVVQNLDAAINIHLAFNTAATTGHFRLAPGEMYESYRAADEVLGKATTFTGELFIIAASGTPNAALMVETGS